MKLLKWNCPIGCGVSACHCFVPGCPATFETIEVPDIAEEESQQMPGHPQNQVPSPEGGTRGIQSGQGSGNTTGKDIQVPILPGLAFH